VTRYLKFNITEFLCSSNLFYLSSSAKKEKQITKDGFVWKACKGACQNCEFKSCNWYLGAMIRKYRAAKQYIPYTDVSQHLVTYKSYIT